MDQNFTNLPSTRKCLQKITENRKGDENFKTYIIYNYGLVPHTEPSRQFVPELTFNLDKQCFRNLYYSSTDKRMKECKEIILLTRRLDKLTYDLDTKQTVMRECKNTSHYRTFKENLASGTQHDTDPKVRKTPKECHHPNYPSMNDRSENDSLSTGFKVRQVPKECKYKNNSCNNDYYGTDSTVINKNIPSKQDISTSKLPSTSSENKELPSSSSENKELPSKLPPNLTVTPDRTETTCFFSVDDHSSDSSSGFTIDSRSNNIKFYPCPCTLTHTGPKCTKNNMECHQALHTVSSTNETSQDEEELSIYYSPVQNLPEDSDSTHSHVSTVFNLATNFPTNVDSIHSYSTSNTCEFAFSSVLGTEKKPANIIKPGPMQTDSDNILEPDKSKIISINEVQTNDLKSTNCSRNNVANITVGTGELEANSSITNFTDHIYTNIKNAKNDFDNYVKSTLQQNRSKYNNKVYHQDAKEKFENLNLEDISLSSKSITNVKLHNLQNQSNTSRKSITTSDLNLPDFSSDDSSSNSSDSSANNKNHNKSNDNKHTKDHKKSSKHKE